MLVTILMLFYSLLFVMVSSHPNGSSSIAVETREFMNKGVIIRTFDSSLQESHVHWSHSNTSDQSRTLWTVGLTQNTVNALGWCLEYSLSVHDNFVDVNNPSFFQGLQIMAQESAIVVVKARNKPALLKNITEYLERKSKNDEILCHYSV